MHPRWIPLAALAFALALSGGSALAQPKKAELEAAKKEAIAIADKGVEAFRGEKYQDAIDAFSRADQRFHVPKFVLYVARAQAKLGKMLEAKATYQTIADEKLAQYAPDEFFAAQADAKKELVELENRIPTVRIEVNGVPAGQAASVTFDGVALAATDLARSLPRNPGAHVIVVTLPGRPLVTRNVNLREGGSESVILEMGVAAIPVSTVQATLPVPTAPPSTGTAVAPATRTAGPDKPSTGVPGLTIAAYAVGGAGLVAGAVFGGLTLGVYNDYNAKPTKDALDQGRTFGLVTDIGFGVAVAGAAVGTIYWLVSRPKSDSAAPPAKTGVFVAPVVGSSSGGVSVTGRF